MSVYRAMFSCYCVEYNHSIRYISQIVCLLHGFVLYCLVKTNTFLTVGASPVWWAQAAISVDLIHTGGAKGTGRGLALINICHRREEQEVRIGSLME